MKKFFTLIIFIINFIILTGCSLNKDVNQAQPKQITVVSPTPVPAKNYINTDIDEDRNGNRYISIFYMVTGLTNEAGEELDIALKKDSNNNDKISSLTLIHRENTKMENIDLNDPQKVQQILNTLKALNVTDDNDKNTINMAISLLNEIK